MSRLEYKYLVPERLLDELRENVLPFLNYDKYTLFRDNREYTVRSLYFDTSTLNSYHEKLSGLMDRNKFRIRSYNERTESSPAFLEIKRKSSDFVYKDRFQLSFSDVLSFLQTKDIQLIQNKTSSETELPQSAKNFLFHYESKGLLPIVNVVYDREAYECKFGSTLRVTFDKHVRSSVATSFENLFDESPLKQSLKGFFVLEIKFHKVLPYWIPQIINRYHLIRQAVSKYTIAVDANKINDRFFQPYSFS